MIIDEDIIANKVLHHIDTMYPDMWTGVAKTARTSVRNCIRNAVVAEVDLAMGRIAYALHVQSHREVDMPVARKIVNGTIREI